MHISHSPMGVLTLVSGYYKRGAGKNCFLSYGAIYCITSKPKYTWLHYFVDSVINIACRKEFVLNMLLYTYFFLAQSRTGMPWMKKVCRVIYWIRLHAKYGLEGGRTTGTQGTRLVPYAFSRPPTFCLVHCMLSNLNMHVNFAKYLQLLIYWSPFFKQTSS